MSHSYRYPVELLQNSHETWGPVTVRAAVLTIQGFEDRVRIRVGVTPWLEISHFAWCQAILRIMARYLNSILLVLGDPLRQKSELQNQEVKSYIETQSVPRSKQTLSRLYKPTS